MEWKNLNTLKTESMKKLIHICYLDVIKNSCFMKTFLFKLYAGTDLPILSIEVIRRTGLNQRAESWAAQVTG